MKSFWWRTSDKSGEKLEKRRFLTVLWKKFISYTRMSTNSDSPSNSAPEKHLLPWGFVSTFFAISTFTIDSDRGHFSEDALELPETSQQRRKYFITSRYPSWSHTGWYLSWLGAAFKSNTFHIPYKSDDVYRTISTWKYRYSVRKKVPPWSNRG